MTSVLDASAGIEVVLNRSRSEVITGVLEVSTRVYSSELYKAEITNALWKYLKAGLINKDTAHEAAHLAINLVDDFSDPAEYTREVLNDSFRLNHSSYDMFYLALSRRTGSILLSLDKELNSLASREGLDILS